MKHLFNGWLHARLKEHGAATDFPCLIADWNMFIQIKSAQLDVLKSQVEGHDFCKAGRG